MKIKIMGIVGILLFSSILLADEVDQFAVGLKSINKTKPALPPKEKTFKDFFKEAVALFGKSKEKNTLEESLKKLGIINDELIKKLLGISIDEQKVYQAIARNDFALAYIYNSSPEERIELLNNTTFLKFLLINKDLGKDSSWYKDVFKRMKDALDDKLKYKLGMSKINDLIDTIEKGSMLKIFSINLITKYFPFADIEEEEEEEPKIDNWD